MIIVSAPFSWLVQVLAGVSPARLVSAISAARLHHRGPEGEQHPGFARVSGQAWPLRGFGKGHGSSGARAATLKLLRLSGSQALWNESLSGVSPHHGLARSHASVFSIPFQAVALSRAARWRALLLPGVSQGTAIHGVPCPQPGNAWSPSPRSTASYSAATGIAMPISGNASVSSPVSAVRVHFWPPSARSRTVRPMPEDSRMT